MATKITAKDFFLHLGTIVTFYASVVALVTLLFEAINVAYPQVTNYYQYYSPSISFQVATLIVVFPLFILLSWLLQKTYANEPALKESWLRKWLAYITLFVAGGVVAGDLITVVYMFLDGRELTTGFLLKVLTLLVIVGGVFVYYLRDIRNAISSGERMGWRVIAILVIVGSIIIGFSVLGSPASQRQLRYDAQRISDLQNIQWQVVNFYQQKGSIPDNLTQLEDPISGFVAPRDPKTNELYEYKLIGQSAKAFELCATFDREMSAKNSSMAYPVYTEGLGKGGENWQHGVGRQCFTRTIDPELYPVRPR